MRPSTSPSLAGAVCRPILGEPDVIVAADVLEFAGIPPPKLRVYPIETHIAEKLLPAPPPTWVEPYKTLADEDGLPWKNLDDVTSAAKAFLDPVLASSSSSTWSPSTWTWGDLR